MVLFFSRNTIEKLWLSYALTMTMISKPDYEKQNILSQNSTRKVCNVLHIDKNTVIDND